MPISWKTDEQIGVHPCSGILSSSSNRKELTTNIGAKWCVQSVLPVENTKRSCCWGSIDVTFWLRQSSESRDEVSGCLGLPERDLFSGDMRTLLGETESGRSSAWRWPCHRGRSSELLSGRFSCMEIIPQASKIGDFCVYTHRYCTHLSSGFLSGWIKLFFLDKISWKFKWSRF